jgi:hypothetical protein
MTPTDVAFHGQRQSEKQTLARYFQHSRTTKDGDICRPENSKPAALVPGNYANDYANPDSPWWTRADGARQQTRIISALANGEKQAQTTDYELENRRPKGPGVRIPLPPPQ